MSVDLQSCIIWYCLNNGMTIAETMESFIPFGVKIFFSISSGNVFEIKKWNLQIPKPDPYDLVENTTPNQIEQVRKAVNEYQIDQRMKLDPLYPIVKNIMIPISQQETIDKLSTKISELEARLKILENK